MSIRIKGWHCQLIIIGALSLLIIPPVYRTYNRTISSDYVAREEVIGYWIQNKNAGAGSSDASKLARSFVVFDTDGKYYVGIDCSSNSCLEAYTGTWYFSNKKNDFFSIIPWGYQAWIKLNTNHDAEPQFYIKKQNEKVQMYRGSYRASISVDEFRRAKGVETEKLKQLVISCSGVSPK
jgi:hypothetical protein